MDIFQSDYLYDQDGFSLENETYSDESMQRREGFLNAGIILASISIIGVVNNFCVFLVIVKHAHLRTPINMMLLSLSLSNYLFPDLCVTFVSLSIHC